MPARSVITALSSGRRCWRSPKATPFLGDRLLRSAVVAYEAGAKIGRALFNAELARLFGRPGSSAPIGASLGGGLMLESVGRRTHQRDVACGQYQLRPQSMAPFRQRRNVFSPRFCRAKCCDGGAARQGRRAGVRRHSGRRGRLVRGLQARTPPPISLFTGAPEILEVYNKPAPACSFAQTACQAAIAVAREAGAKPADIEAVDVRVSHAAYNYPGCNFQGRSSVRCRPR